MKTFIKKAAAALLGIAVITASCVQSFTAAAYAKTAFSEKYKEPKIEDRFEEYAEDTVFPKTSYIVTGDVVLNKPRKNHIYQIPPSYTVYVRNGGRLIIKDGALLQADGKIVVEKGGSIEIRKNSFLTLHGTINNYGTITVKKNGRININGEYRSNGAAVLKANGTVAFGERNYTPERSTELSKIKKKILKYDRNFSLDSYCLCKENNYIYLYYCIDGIRTDHYYRAVLGGSKLDVSKYPLEKVYDKELAEKLKKAAADFKDSDDRYKRFTADNNYLGLDFGFCFSYENGVLSFYNEEASYFEAEGRNGTFLEVEEEKIDIEY